MDINNVLSRPTQIDFPLWYFRSIPYESSLILCENDEERLLVTDLIYSKLPEIEIKTHGGSNGKNTIVHKNNSSLEIITYEDDRLRGLRGSLICVCTERFLNKENFKQRVIYPRFNIDVRKNSLRLPALSRTIYILETNRFEYYLIK